MCFLFSTQEALVFLPRLPPAKRSGHFDIKTLLLSSSAFFKSQFFSVPGHPIGCTCGIGTSKSFEDWNIGLLQSIFFKPPRNWPGLQVMPRSLFKRLVLSTTLWQHAMMSTALKSPKGLKDLECKKGQLSSWPPVPYVPPTDLVTTKEAPESLKIKLPNETVFNMSSFS
jgi:hypothetical protein